METMLLADIEGEVSWLYAQARVDEDDPTNIVELAQRFLGGTERVRRVGPRELYRDARLCTLDGVEVILVRSDLTLERLNFGIAHELGEYVFRKRRYLAEDRELVCSVFGAAALAPRRALLAALRAGLTIAQIAEGFHVTQTCAALRVGEATGRPVAVVTPALVRIRGEEWGWPGDDGAIRRLGEVAVPQVHRVEISDARMRFALLAW